MPDKREPQPNAAPAPADPPPDDLQDAMRRMKIQEGGGGDGDAPPNPYPDRPGEPDCMYYLRTGSCGYGSSCRYNHPAGTAAKQKGGGGEVAERAGQPDCQYFLKTGTCKFGAICRYHHPHVKHDARPVSLNILGLPMRQDEKSCPYYMRTGSCKFGYACKFNHPPPATVGGTSPITGPSTYGSAGSSMAPPSGAPLIGGFSPRPLSRSPYMSSPRMPSLPSYMPMILPPSQGTMPLQQGWSIYTGTTSPVPSTDFLGNTQLSNSKHLAQSGSSIPLNLPERPDKPECLYYMKTGSCKYGTTCKYHHPKERNSPAMCMIGPLGLPLRPGQAVCTLYSMYGICKYGSACKFDHPLIGYYNYSQLALSISDPPTLLPSHGNSQVMWTAAETLPSKAKASDHLIKPETSNGTQDEDSKEQGDHAQSIALSHTAPSSASSRDHSE